MNQNEVDRPPVREHWGVPVAIRYVSPEEAVYPELPDDDAMNQNSKGAP